MLTRVYSRFLSISFIVQTGIHVVRGAAIDMTRSTYSSTKGFRHGAWRDISCHKVAQRSVLVLNCHAVAFRAGCCFLCPPLSVAELDTLSG